MTHHQLKVQRDIFLIATSVSLLVLVINIVWRNLPVQAEFASPASDLVVIEREVEKVVEVPRLPQSIEDEICAVFGSHCSDALKVARCESGLNAKSANKTSSARGLFQVMSSVHGIREKWLYNPHINIQVAKMLFDASGWEPWRASNNCHKLLR